MSDLVLSLFPGIGLLDMAFEREGFCVVRGPDPLWGGDIREHHPPTGKFDGVIGGPPCQEFSALAPLVRHNGGTPRWGNLIPEYERVVAEAQPAWFLMENVRGAPLPDVEGYDRWATLLRDSDVGGVQPRLRRFTLGLRPGLWPDDGSSPWSLCEYGGGGAQGQSVVVDGRAVPAKIGGSGKLKRTVTSAAHGSFGASRRDPDSGRPGKRKASVKSDPRPTRREARDVERILEGHRFDVADMCEAQGLPHDYLDDAPFTVQGKRSAIGNGVPQAMGRAVARVVKAVLDG